MQVINYSHLFPTRYAFELEGLKGTVSSETFKEPSQREDAKKNIKKQLEERYQSGKNKWFFQPLRVRCFVFSTGQFDSYKYLVFPNSSDCTLSILFGILKSPPCVHHDRDSYMTHTSDLFSKDENDCERYWRH